MGNIRAAIALYDGVTSPLQSMHKAMGVVLNTFEAMQQASGRAVDTAAIREAREEWAKAGTAFDTIEENIRNANSRISTIPSVGVAIPPTGFCPSSRKLPLPLVVSPGSIRC